MILFKKIEVIYTFAIYQLKSTTLTDFSSINWKLKNRNCIVISVNGNRCPNQKFKNFVS